MQGEQQNIFFRNDTIFGVCEAVGSDLGFHPNWLRLAFAAPVYWAPVLTVGIYLALGLVVLATRYAFPDVVASVGAPAAAPALASAEAPAADAAADEDAGERRLVAA